MEIPKDDLKWFGEGFDGFPKRLPDDCVEYMLFIIDTALTQKQVLTRLEVVRKEALLLKGKLLKEYIWQREDFQLKVEVQKADSLIYLHGLTNYGDSVEDEWLIVYMLRELSNQFPDLWIKVVDTDGEFLLIEAANALPRWLNPEIADNRVWINKHKLRIIPLTATSNSSSTARTVPVSRSLTLPEAIKIISNTPEILINSPLVEAEAFYRLKNYPSQVLESLHHAIITVPRKLAYILHNCPAAISPAVEAFYLRDPIALKPLQSTSSTLIFPPSDLVSVSTRFTKVLYAQVKSQLFSTPHAWKSIILDRETAVPKDATKQPELARIEMGIKVTSGFEMLLGDSKNRDNRSVREIQIFLDDLAEDATLPTDSDIAEWLGSKREDSEAWLDINFEDFEKELQGKNRDTKPAGPEGTFGPEVPSGFGDAKTQADLKKMVQRFEEFMNDEDAGADGAELDDMDYDDDDDEDDDDDDDEEDKEVSFNEEEFAKMMREMMGMPPEEGDKAATSKKGKAKETLRQFEELDSDEEDEADEAEEMRKVMERIEAELNEAGALDLDPTPAKLAALKPRGKSGGKLEQEEDWEDESEDEVNIDFNLVQNLLESFKSQAGMAGPGGNLMGMMGMQLPRDEDDSQAASPKRP